MTWWDCEYLFYNSNHYNILTWWDNICVLSNNVEYESTKVIDECKNLTSLYFKLKLPYSYKIKYLWKNNCEIIVDKKEMDDVYKFYKEGFSLNQVLIIEFISILLSIFITSILSIFIYKKIKKV